jgi:hypothetical protein
MNELWEQIKMIDGETLGFITAFGAVVVNIAALVWNIRQTSINHVETEKLAKLAANLDERINRLSVSLNQEIAHLNRILDLVRGTYLSLSIYSKKFTFMSHAVGGNPREAEEKPKIYTLDEMAQTYVTFDGSLVEMLAIARSMDNAELESQINDFATCVHAFDPALSIEENKKRDDRFFKATSAIQEMIYRLLQDATDKE